VKKKLFLNSFSGTALYVVNVVIMFIMSPVIIRALGNRDYGLWELVMSVIGYMGLLDLGIGPALVRFVSVADGKEDRNDLQQTISTAFAFFLGVGCVALLLFSAIGCSPGVIAGKETKDIAKLGTVFLLLGIDAAMLFPMQVFITALMGLQRHYFINSARGGMAITRAVLTYKLLQLYPGKGLIVIAFLEPIFNFVQFMLMAGAVYCDKKVPRMALSAVSRGKMKELLTFGAKSATMMVASRLQNQSVPFIISHVIGLGHIIYFVLPNRLVDYAKGVSQAIGFPLVPYFGASIGRGDQKELLKSWFATTLALQFVSLAMPLVIFFYGEIFLGLWIGHEYAAAGHWVIYILLVGLIADSLASNSSRILTAQSRHGRCAAVWLFLSAASIPIGIWGAMMWRVPGVALGTTFVTVAGNLITMYLACSVMEISLTTYFRETVLPLSVPLLSLACLMWLMSSFIPVKNYLALLAQLIVAGCVYCLGVWRFTLSADMRKHLYDRLNRRIAPQE